MTDFKAGDRVRTYGNIWGRYEGKEGVVTDRLSASGQQLMRLDGSDIDWTFNDSWPIELVKAANVAEGATKVDVASNAVTYHAFEAGDIVKIKKGRSLASRLHIGQTSEVLTRTWNADQGDWEYSLAHIEGMLWADELEFEASSWEAWEEKKNAAPEDEEVSWDDNGEAVDTGDWRKVTMEELNKESDTPLTVYSSDTTVVPADVANPFHAKVRAILSEIGDTIIAKNEQYGNSALEPVRIFSKASATEQIKVRMDDKISRLVRGNGEGDEDAAFDLLGYIVLLKIAESEDD